MNRSLICIILGVAFLASHATAFTPDPTKYYKLVSRFLENKDVCLEGNRFSPSSTLSGAAFMAPCTPVHTGQMWKFIPQGNGYYKMTTRFLEKENKCFEGNRFASTSTLKGAAFMDNCQNVSGQFWKIKLRSNVPSGYFTLTTMFRENFNECLEGNEFKAGNTLNGAAFMAGCGRTVFTGQQWKAVAV